jgi:hypothetical protein
VPSRFEQAAIRVHQELADPTVARLMGRKYLSTGQQARRIVWVHAPSTVDLPQQAGGELVNGQRRRIFWDRLENAEIHVFAETEGLTDQLFDNLLGAMARAITRLRMDSYTWPNDEEGQAGFNERQWGIVLRCAIRLQVSDERKQLKSIEAVEHNCQLITDDTPFDPEPAPPDP